MTLDSHHLRKGLKLSSLSLSLSLPFLFPLLAASKKESVEVIDFSGSTKIHSSPNKTSSFCVVLLLPGHVRSGHCCRVWSGLDIHPGGSPIQMMARVQPTPSRNPGTGRPCSRYPSQSVRQYSRQSQTGFETDCVLSLSLQPGLCPKLAKSILEKL